ncbi:MBL fold metallo-hydrolase [Clostridium kluyveri]|uniref:MBL fold metallo-hydrolase n=1 Tax=Clostridium kluyveri TaxID=1534 RepID=UPI002246C872|nr:MBL fold metallo-hydrolase [Clostridium kluyveri]UZQ49823.1 MBL fold metallo-hydrolase [Clostridium kluyveri]
MKLIVLGSGSAGNCYLLQNKDETLILECGLPYKTILKGLDFNLMNVVGCLVTHCHNDHSKAIKELISNGIDVYSSGETLKAIDAGNYRVQVIKSENQISIGDFTVLPFETEHDAVEPLGFLIQHNDMGKLLFITDSYYCQYNFTGLNHIMIECNYSMDIVNENFEKGLIHPVLRNRLLKSHFSLENVKEFLKVTDLSQVRDIVLLHLSDSNSDEERFKTEIERLTGKPTYIADKGLKIDLF